MDLPTWKVFPCDKVHTTADLLTMRARQLQCQDEDLKEAALIYHAFESAARTNLIQEHASETGSYTSET